MMTATLTTPTSPKKLLSLNAAELSQADITSYFFDQDKQAYIFENGVEIQGDLPDNTSIIADGPVWIDGGTGNKCSVVITDKVSSFQLDSDGNPTDILNPICMISVKGETGTNCDFLTQCETPKGHGAIVINALGEGSKARTKNGEIHIAYADEHTLVTSSYGDIDVEQAASTGHN